MNRLKNKQYIDNLKKYKIKTHTKISNVELFKKYKSNNEKTELFYIKDPNIEYKEDTASQKEYKSSIHFEGKKKLFH